MKNNKKELRQTFDKKYMPEISFMDPKMVKQHLNVISFYAKELKTRQIKSSIHNQTDKNSICKSGIKTLHLFAKANTKN